MLPGSLKKILRNALRAFYFFAYYLGIIRFFYWLNRKKQCVLVFHHIIPDALTNDSFEQKLVCSQKAHFEKLISLVNKRFEITTEIGKPGSAIITFDDGYRAALVAEEVLDKFNNKAYFFVPLSVISAGPLWIDKIMSWFAYVSAGEYSISGKVYSLKSAEERQKAYSEIIDSLYSKSYDYHSIITQLAQIKPFDSLNIPEEYFNFRFRGLTIEEINHLKENGHKIGGHSIRHDILSLLSEQVLEDDFEQCSSAVNKLINCKVYAYPFGHPRDISPLCIKYCAKSPFEKAFMNEYIQAPTDYTLSRINISHFRSRYEVEAEMSGLKQWLRNILKWRK